MAEERLLHEGQDDGADIALLLASANAVQRLIAEHRELRKRVAELENELALFRRHAKLANEGYRKLTEEFVAQFRLIDNAVNDIFSDSAAAADPLEEQLMQTPSPASTAAA